ncbi:SpvB/TcaC N-terminal domain-containing protein [Burkholderia pseudomallei]|uniref:SpvB/TcaC N-terminal domain-containing protein n=1 Tax=Burkholderia pseudomallei TaxID=28450 RepID=UPI00040D9CEB|nr:SpvB/TcaC N-terminal domain-containing protein [Burkholderia pseudomallei]AIP54860.1 RHS repeat-associated core domain protein [Burkholderia pseudomallei HBPUB10134a]AIP56317.1 RHS repeat-associated core domain protein [Burkholderia pseudomallei HBPUB10303a]CAJ3481937.1 insecticidal toxin complex protein TcdB2 [Burkholderia pseudomallei]CAJ3553127.1 insecticidal toxin complex protein TcdB2 [Burkholderia pseudomallei]CAJ4670550.1 insecticidal toxin complex protein TcdB2 [Burkholderia pseudom
MSPLPTTTPTPPLQVVTAAFPKGGGALPGLGQTLSPSGMSGAAQLSIALPLPPVRLAPALALTYHSQQGNGPFGLGVALTLPTLARQTSRGTPSYADGRDVFVFEGDELVPDTAGPTEVDNERLTRYHMRHEGRFDYLELHQPLTPADAPAPAWWRVWRADGRCEVFGRCAAARTAVPGNPAQVLEWHLEETVSPHGEHVYYSYAPREAEAARTQLACLKQVRFGNVRADPAPWSTAQGFDPATERWLFALVFDYGEHADTPQGPAWAASRPWRRRADPFSRFDGGFELRCERLCQRIVLFHQLAALGAEPVAVRALQLSHTETAYLTQLTGVRQHGYRQTGGALEQAALPPLALEYTRFDLGRADFRALEAGLVGLNAGFYQVVDLYGEGVPGILYNDGQSYRYRRAKNVKRGDQGLDVEYEAAQSLSVPGGEMSAAALMDITGDGILDAVRTEPGMAGFFTRDGDKGWQRFIPFAAFPSEFLHPRALLADLSGDGLADLALIGPSSVRLFVNRGHDGFAPPRQIDHLGPDRLPVPPGGGQTLTAFADVLGSGQPHLVRVRHNEVTCWPNLGQGRFGAPRTLRLRLDPAITAANFDPARVWLADLDGSGAADLLYLDHRTLYVHRNQCGNRFARAQTLSLPAALQYTDLHQVSVADLYGNGTSVLIISRLHPQPAHWVCDFSRGLKPYLLAGLNDNMGAQTRLTYASSAHEWLDERRADSQARCRLPFPVSVLKRLEQVDEINHNTLEQTLQYRQGYYDGEERQFRGFGLILSTDMPSPLGAAQRDAAGTPYIPALQTRTWYYTGDPDSPGAVDGNVGGSSYNGDPLAAALSPLRIERRDGQAIPLPPGTPERRVLLRALRGRVRREEVYGLNPTTGQPQATPFRVMSLRYCVREWQPATASGVPAVLLAFVLESLDYNYDQVSTDPQWQQTVALAVDTYGMVTKTVSLHYPRRAQVMPPIMPLPEAAHCSDAQQDTFLVTETRIRVTHLQEPKPNRAGWRLGLPVENRDEMLGRVAPPTSANRVYSYEELTKADGPLASATRTLARWQQQIYADPSTGDPLPLAQATREGLVCQVRTAALSQAELRRSFEGLIPSQQLEPLLTQLEDELVNQAGFVQGTAEDDKDYFWNPGLTATFADLAGFYTVRYHTDPFGNRTTYERDALTLAPTLLSNARFTAAWIDYDPWSLLPAQITDANGTVHEVSYDPFGRVHLSALKGSERAFTDSLGEARVGFGPLAGYRSSVKTVEAALRDPTGALGNAAQAYFHADHSWMGALTEAGLRAAGLPDSEVQAVWQILLQQRLITVEGYVQARLHQLAKAGTPVPGLSDTQSAAVHRAVAAVSRVPVHAATLSAERYRDEHADDPVPRPTDPVIRIALAYVDGFGRPLQGKIKAEGGLSAIVEDDGKLKLDTSGRPLQERSEERWLTQGHVVYNAKGLPRQQYQPYYLNRPVHLTDPKLDQLSASDTLYYDAPGRLAQLTKADGNRRTSQYRPWYRIETDEMGAPVATVHDGRGLAVRTVQRPPPGAATADKVRITRHAYDAAGRLVSSSDPRFFGRQQAGETTLAGNERYRYGLSGSAVTRESRDAGWQVDLLDAGGALWRSYTARDHQWRREYDALRRLSAVWLASGMSRTERCTERLRYGDDAGIDAVTARRANLRGRLVSHYDPAGLREITSYSLGGMIREEQRRFLQQRDWSSDWPATPGAAAAHLEEQIETSRWQCTALGDELMLLDAAGHRHRCAWHVSGRPSGSWLQLSGGAEQAVVSELSYTADHQLLHEQAGNGVTSDFEYDPQTRRLSRAQTTRTASGRAATVLQDLRYTYDRVGNVTQLADQATRVRYFRNQRVAAVRTYQYDWLYQLVRATGREQANAGQEGVALPPVGNPDALVNYTRTFAYDAAGNLTRTVHRGATRYVLALAVSRSSNRAVAGRRVGADDVEAQFDAQGNPHRLGSNQPLTWSADNRLSRAVQLPRTGGEDDSEAYGYGGDGQRVRKWSSQQAGAVTHRREVRYLPGLERRTNTATGEVLEVVSSAVAGRTAMRCLHWRASRPGGLDNDMRRYSVNDHLGSSGLELDQSGQRLSAEEYYPYGGTAVWLPKSQVEGNYKFVRHAGKERDVSGLYDYGYRHYAPWLARWLNPDPAGTVDGLNLYRMVRNNPVTFIDRDGIAATRLNWLDLAPAPSPAAVAVASRKLDSRHTSFPPTTGLIQNVKVKNEALIGQVLASHLEASRGLSAPIEAKKFPQLELPPDMIFRLGRIDEDSYLLFPTAAGKVQKIPYGTLSYVIRYEDPLSIYVFEHSELAERKDLTEKVIPRLANYGHSSLTYKEDKPNMFDRSIPKAERFRQSAKPVLLAGNLNFEMAEYPQLGAGRLISWSVESGHFQPTDKDAVKNRIGFIQQLLPIGKFNRIDWEEKRKQIQRP